jgi:hypothetical protein
MVIDQLTYYLAIILVCFAGWLLYKIVKKILAIALFVLMVVLVGLFIHFSVWPL